MSEYHESCAIDRAWTRGMLINVLK